ncbi:MAG: hypothetical protein L7F77_16325 [Candidatus Magnetominusculus sp. LBB02]|nr:hypothetical protein [Candidatus Magnetominusculus sp. LBB02]
MVIYERPVQIDKRKGADLIVKSIHWTIAVCWVVIFIAWTYVYYARPDETEVFGRYRQASLYWDVSMLKKAFVASTALLMISVAGLAESFFRHRRAEDRTPKTLILMAAMSVIGIFALYFYF